MSQRYGDLHDDDEEDEEEEEEELLDQSFVLRLPEHLADKLRTKMKQLEKAGRAYESHRNRGTKSERRKYEKQYRRAHASVSEFIKIEPAVDPTTHYELDGERFHVYIGNKCYPAKLFCLPCITEMYASSDKPGLPRPGEPKKSGDLTKSGDVGQILVVHDMPRQSESAEMDWSWIEDPELVYTKLEASRTQKEDIHETVRDGLTHPSKDIYTKRWAGPEFSNGWYPLRRPDQDPNQVNATVNYRRSSSSAQTATVDAGSLQPPLTRTDIEDMCRILTNSYVEAVEYTQELRDLPWAASPYGSDCVRVYPA